MPQRQTSGLMIAIVLITYLLVGCGNTLPSTVTGTVTLDGDPLPDGSQTTGSVVFHPVEGGAAAYGTITSGGKYSMHTGDADGLQPGAYLVTVRVVEIEPPPPGGYNSPPAAKLLTPPRYQDRERTDLNANVLQGKNEIDLKLSSP